MNQKILGLAISSLFLMTTSSVLAKECVINYTMKGWAAFYKSYEGTGVVSCPGGMSGNVNLSLTGGGFTFGAYEVIEGQGKIRGVETFDDIYGGSFMMDGDAGFGKSIEVRWAPKGARTVTLTGKGTGYDLGWAMGVFKITQP